MSRQADDNLEVKELESALDVDDVTHHSCHLSWELAYEEAKSAGAADKVKMSVERQRPDGSWSQEYLGYSVSMPVQGLHPGTEYVYRACFHTAEAVLISGHVSVRTKKEPPTCAAVQRAIFIEDLEALETILKSPEIHGHLDSPDKTGQSPLMKCSAKGYLQAMEMLLAAGADTNYCNAAGKTALMTAAYAGQVDACTLLLQHGANLEERDRAGSSALHAACDGGHAFVVQWFLNHGCSVEQRDAHGRTPLIRTGAISGSREVGTMLVCNEADMEAEDKKGQTALVCGVLNGKLPFIEVLLYHGADPNHKDKSGRTPRAIAKSLEKPIIVRAIDEHEKK